MQLSRLTYVYDDDPGPLGRLLAEIRGMLRFGEGSGLVDVSDIARNHGVSGLPVPEVSIRVASVAYSALAPDVREELASEGVPCVLGHAETKTVVLLPPRSIARWNGGLSDLRGKIRFALAKHEWTL